MPRTITIAGVDRTEDIKVSDFTIEQVLTYQEDNCDFTVKSGDKPTAGQEIIVTDDSIKKFGGIIDVVDDTEKGQNVKFYKCQARDYTYQADRRLVVETYENMPADEILVDIAEKYCPGFTVTNVQSGAPVVEKIIFDYKRPSECFRELCDYVGWQWFIDYDKDIHFFDSADLTSPAPVIVNVSANVRKLVHNIEIEGLRNRVYVRGGSMLSDAVTYEYVADGSQRAWILPYKPHDLTISESGGVAQTPGVENLVDELTTSKRWLMNYQEKTVRLVSSQADIAQGTTVAFTFQFDIPVITMVEDLESQAAIAAVQGGDGVYEHVIIDDSLVTIDAAEAAGNADLREYGNPRVKGSFITEIDGWAPGQLVEIDLPDRGIENTFLIQRVTIQPFTPTVWTYRIEYGGRLIGIEDYLRALVSAQQKKQLSDTAIIYKYSRVQEKVKVVDEVVFTYREPPFYCGDDDAYCGFVECSE